MSETRTITLDEFRAEVKAQGVKSHEDVAFICPMCGTIQSGRDLIAAEAGKDFDEIEKYVGFSCIGRWMNAGSPLGKKARGPCNWTLGGLFQTHKLEVITPDGQRHPRFELASPEQAQEHALRKMGVRE